MSALIVEDEIIIALDVKNILKSLGISISGIVSSGEESIKKVPQVRPHFILMDIKLNGKMDGIHAAEKIYYKYKIPSIFLTAYGDELTLKRIRETKLFYFITKPFSEYEITQSINKTRKKFDLI